MINADSFGHMTTVELNATLTAAYEYLVDPFKLGHWALGCRDIRATSEKGVYEGTSLFDGSATSFRIQSYPDIHVIDYYVGSLASLQPRISIRLVPGPVYDSNDQFCLVSLCAWRGLQMNDERWRQLCTSHEAEILLIKAQIERECSSGTN